MAQLVAPKSPSTPTIQNWLRHADATAEIIREHYQHLEGQALINAAAEENVLVQLEHLRTLPVISSRLSNDRVSLHGWMYKIETGEIFAYDSTVSQFVKFGDRSVRAANGNGLANANRPEPSHPATAEMG
jgi:carbonic anhydrase